MRLQLCNVQEGCSAENYSIQGRYACEVHLILLIKGMNNEQRRESRNKGAPVVRRRTCRLGRSDEFSKKGTIATSIGSLHNHELIIAGLEQRPS